MRLTVDSGKAMVTVPGGVSLQAARTFAMENSSWIRHHMARMERKVQDARNLLRDLAPLADIHEAGQKIIYRARLLSMETGLSCSRITVRNQKTRWGSCSSRNCISLNIKLARLPEALMDYVILHELVHTRIKDHGPDFWQELDRYVGDSRKLRRELGKYMLQYL